MGFTPYRRYIRQDIATKEQLIEDDKLSIAQAEALEAEMRLPNIDNLSDSNSNRNSNSVGPIKLTMKEKHRRLSEAFCDILSDRGLVSFLPLNIEDVEVSHAHHTTSSSSSLDLILLILMPTNADSEDGCHRCQGGRQSQRIQVRIDQFIHPRLYRLIMILMNVTLLCEVMRQ